MFDPFTNICSEETKAIHDMGGGRESDRKENRVYGRLTRVSSCFGKRGNVVRRNETSQQSESFRKTKLLSVRSVEVNGSFVAVLSLYVYSSVPLLFPRRFQRSGCDPPASDPRLSSRFECPVTAACKTGSTAEEVKSFAFGYKMSASS